MMNYYILHNHEIALCDTDKSKLQTTLKFKPELSEKEIRETEREIVLLDNKFVFADEHQEEIKQKEVETLSKEMRAKRDAELVATDFYTFNDYPISEEDLDKIKIYRQQLRDLPQNPEFPYIDFPTNPLKEGVTE